VSRGLAYAPYVDLLWCETGKPDLAFAKQYAERSTGSFPAKCWPTTAPLIQLKKNLDDGSISRFQHEAEAMGYKYQFNHAGRLP